jgi:hypothetical protein
MPIRKDELPKALEHLAFDICHFRLYVERLRSGSTQQDRASFQAMLYALLLHFRLLIDFFYGKPTQDDCCVCNFDPLDGFEQAFPASLRQEPKWKAEVSGHLNKRLAHFTASRWRETRPPMDYYAQHFGTILDLISRFEQALPPESRQQLGRGKRMWT